MRDIKCLNSSSRTLVVAPHADDETLGCGGLMLRRKEEGGEVAWMLMTSMTEDKWSSAQIQRRAFEIERVREEFGIEKEHLYQLNFPVSALDAYPLSDIVTQAAQIVEEFRPTDLIIPSQGDAHSDHRVTFDALSACSKWFRNRSVERVFVYETLSETNFGLHSKQFLPNYYVDISTQLESKLALARLYESEFENHPFPRSEVSLRALASIRGSECGVDAAEAFMLLKARE